jgi:hypothetical protein
MKLYRVSNQSRHAPQEWAGTQDEARKRSKEIGGFFDPIEVPTDKPGLLDWLNKNVTNSAPAAEMLCETCRGAGCPECAQKGAVEAPDDFLAAAEERAVRELDARTAQRDRLVQGDWDAHSIQEFILERASVAQCEAIFACFGTRFKELAREVRGQGG